MLVTKAVILLAIVELTSYRTRFIVKYKGDHVAFFVPVSET